MRKVIIWLLPILAFLAFFRDAIAVSDNELVHLIRSSIRGRVYEYGSPGFNSLRKVTQGRCNEILPTLVARPNDIHDVSKIVKIAKQYGKEVSVRSGGHSYQCLALKPGSIHIDMRSINTVKWLGGQWSIIGTGNTWGGVRSILPPSKFTFTHGQCSDVGVGGYLLGLGYHTPGLSNTLGVGADNVAEYKLVLPDGSIASVNNHNTTVYDESGHHPVKVVQHEYDNDLRYGLRSAGNSLAIVTDFTYRTVPRPEPLPVVVPIFVEDPYDLRRLEAIARTDKYSMLVLANYFYRRPLATNLLGSAASFLPGVLRKMAGKKVDPVILSIMEVNPKGKKSNLQNILNLLKHHGIKIALDNPTIMELVTLDAMDLTYKNQHVAYLTEEQVQKEGLPTIASANMNEMSTTQHLEQVFFHDKIIGLYPSLNRSPHASKSPCDMCMWFLAFGRSATEPGSHGTSIAVEMTCSYNHKNPRRSKHCPRMVANVKNQFVSEAVRLGLPVRQYVNTPSCDGPNDNWQKKYFGDSYERLLNIKKFWDPDNFFNHCQSIGSTRNDCCYL